MILLRAVIILIMRLLIFMLGNKVMMTTETAVYNFNKTIDVHTLPAGVYMVKVEYADQVNTIRLVKE